MQIKNMFPTKYFTNCVARMPTETYQKIWLFQHSKRFEKHSLAARRRFLRYFKRFNVFIDSNLFVAIYNFIKQVPYEAYSVHAR